MQVAQPMVVHGPDRLTSRRHLLSWALLAFSAGAVNAGALMACQRFVAHLTGTLTRLGADAAEIVGVDSLLVLGSFVAGAAISVLLVRRLGRGNPPYWIPLSIVSLILSAVAVLGHSGAFGPFGGTVEAARDVAFLGVLSFAMGMQNAAVATSTGMVVRTTHVTGPATDLAVALATLVDGNHSERTAAKESIRLRGTKLVAFVLGAAAMVPLCARFGFLAFIVPAATCALATASSFSPGGIAEPPAVSEG